MSKVIKVTIPPVKPRNWIVPSARTKKGGVHQDRCSRSAEKQAWMQDWSDDLIMPSRNQFNTDE